MPPGYSSLGEATSGCFRGCRQAVPLLQLLAQAAVAGLVLLKIFDLQFRFANSDISEHAPPPARALCTHLNAILPDLAVSCIILFLYFTKSL